VTRQEKFFGLYPHNITEHQWPSRGTDRNSWIPLIKIVDPIKFDQIQPRTKSHHDSTSSIVVQVGAQPTEGLHGSLVVVWNLDSYGSVVGNDALHVQTVALTRLLKPSLEGKVEPERT
jgi:hypothetical protein